MKTVAFLVFSLWLGMGNFAYASARLECASMMQSGHHSCAPSASCQCSIEVPSSDRTVPVNATIQLEAPSVIPALVTEAITPVSPHFSPDIFSSPPKQPPLYQLFSTYRI